MKRLPRSLIRVTLFSKILALLLMLAFLGVAFYSGMQFQQKYVEIAGTTIPTPTPAVQDKMLCRTDSDCLFTTKDTALSCCPNTRCIRYADEGILAVNAMWFKQQQENICGAKHVCPMYAVVCTKSITEENNHYTAKCIQHVCTKVQS